MFFNGALGVPAHIIYWAAFALGGGFLFYFGYNDSKKASIATCLVLGTFFLAMGLINTLNVPINSESTFIMANYQGQGSADYILSFIAAFFLYAGAFDWYRRYKNKPVEQKKFNPALK